MLLALENSRCGRPVLVLQVVVWASVVLFARHSPFAALRLNLRLTPGVYAALTVWRICPCLYRV